MHPQRTTASIPALVLLALLVLAGMSFLNYRYASQNPGGEDFLTYWMGTRSLLFDGISPYSETVQNRIRIATSGWPEEHTQNLSITYPLYAALFFLPFAAVRDFVLARALWMTFLEAGVILLAVFSVRIARWRTERWMLPLFLLFGLFWFHSVYPVWQGSAAILVALFVALALSALRSGNDEAAGALLALATIKPLMVVLLLLFVNLWAIVQGRWKFVVWFWGTMALLVLGGFFFVSDWLLGALRSTIAAWNVVPVNSPGEAFALWWPGVGSRFGMVLTGVMAMLLLWEWWLAFSRREINWFLWTACFTLAAGMWTGIPTEPANFIILLPALALVFASMDERWKNSGRLFSLLSMGLMLVLPWVIFLFTASDDFLPSQYPGLFFPLPLFLIITLYWVRWWAVRPRRPLLDQIRAGEEGI